MSKLVFYFHGFGSSPESTKVSRLKESLPDSEIYAFPINIDPRVALPELCERIESVLLDEPHSEDSVLFVGTSLGAWYAGYLANLYGLPSILINPSCTPSVSLERYDIPVSIRGAYSDLEIPENAEVYLAERDEVLNNEELKAAGSPIIVPGADHRFDGEPFSLVIERIREMMLDKSRP
jgi:hypothetical protein